ncbi:DgyrCDS14644 [Dimorphilus gyrociliatus]|uniref:DgyrCDS14644 n=1 Tax=Dimorphilus gyrociliatus TaxID=2664684 RepID=A0A7I8WEA9_9ANNE|nr:DgyrCDS14644 [Dimorphilus gyrociliatus]
MFKNFQAGVLFISILLFKNDVKSDKCIDNILKENMKLIQNDINQRIDNLISSVNNPRLSKHSLKQIECKGQITLNQKLNGKMITDYLITSKDYPSDYPNNHNCMIIMNVEEAFNGYIEFTFHEFHLEFSKNCRYDSLTISDDRETVTLCGKGLMKNSTANFGDNVNVGMHPTINKTIKLKPNGALVIHFKTGNKFTKSGFVLKVNFRNDKLNCNRNGTVSDKIDKITEMIQTRESRRDDFYSSGNYSDENTTISSNSSSSSSSSNISMEINSTTPMPQLTPQTREIQKSATLLVNNKTISCDSLKFSELEFDCNGKSYDIISNNPYLPNSNCRIDLLPPKEKNGTIFFKFKYFSTESSLECKYDYVQIVDDHGLTHEFCGDQILGDKGNTSLQSTRYPNEVDINKTYFTKMKKLFQLRFKSDDGFNQFSGFHLRTTFSCQPFVLPERQVLCKRNSENIQIHCDMGDLRIIAPISKTNKWCSIILAVHRKKIEVEFEFLSFNLKKKTGMNYNALQFALNFQYIKYSGKANEVGTGKNRISLFSGEDFKPPKLGTTYYISETGDLGIHYSENTDTVGNSFEMIARAKCTS